MALLWYFYGFMLLISTLLFDTSAPSSTLLNVYFHELRI